MLKVETYQSIDDKKRLDKVEKPLSDQESIIRSLDFLDFRAELQHNNPNMTKTVDFIDWIDLNFLDNDNK